ncbi:unnamed protein product [Notodromas monacha]|uniref:Uncharacterized protein n=1 Tax=Notodromas monacha TaxID=399045 RepID=A0A7R9C0Y8_9CRUS|nr:unnamed protein product [Notodromas monacha]CAG0924007.1 unnamed protein product [Notodromas monacha]
MPFETSSLSAPPRVRGIFLVLVVVCGHLWPSRVAMAAPLPLRNTNNNGADAGSGEEEELATGGSAGLGGSGVGDERVARWINPCRAVSDPDLLGPAEAAADVQVVRPIRISASTALNFAEEFRDEYPGDRVPGIFGVVLRPEAGSDRGNENWKHSDGVLD